MMLTKMRRRFIASAMAAMGAVTLVLLVAINLWNYNITTNRLDDTINSLITTGKIHTAARLTSPFRTFSAIIRRSQNT